MKVTVYRPFYDLEEGVDRHAGEVFECTEERFNVIKSKLPAFVSGEATTTTKKTTRKATTRKTAKK
jgi:hypothetical protein